MVPDPEIFFTPTQAPEAAQEVAFAEDQVIIEDWPKGMDAGDTEMATVGSGWVKPDAITENFPLMLVGLFTQI